MVRFSLIRLVVFGLAFAACGGAFAQKPPTLGASLGTSAKAVLGSWEFSNAERDKKCTALFKSDHTAAGFKVEFDANCANLFPLVNDVAGWIFPENDLLRLIDKEGKSLVEFSEVEDGIYEAPTPGVGVLFLQNAADAGTQSASPDQMAGEWIMMRGSGTRLCALALSSAALRDGFTLTVKPGCAESIAQLGFTEWRLDDGELILNASHASPWRFEEIDNVTWRRLPESADSITLVKQQ